MIPAWLPIAILALPLGLSGLTVLLPRSRPGLAHSLAAAGMAVATGLSAWLAALILPDGLKVQGLHTLWLDAGGFALGVGVFVDPMAAVMTVLVCLLATLVLVYNSWYMEGDALAARFPWQFCFFVFAMLGVVLADNLFMSFICWELVGLGSYLLIGFWFAKPAVGDDPAYQRLKGAGARGVLEDRLSPAHAQLKAFVMNRVGDAGFLIGIGALLAAGAAGGIHEPLTWANLHLLSEGGSLPGTFLGLSGDHLLTLAALGIFCGAVGKSAQFPLHTWLPDAMQGPTTASSIIHAATMVAAGVYLVARCYPLFTPDALTVVGLTGGITCLLAATIACVQWDLKAVLAYSTVSQLGLMFVGLGAGPEAGGQGAGMGHLFTHALFKCLLFLCAGAIIHATHGCQDLARLGGLWRRMPVTALASLLAVLSIIGAPFFSGFYTKDAVLGAALINAQTAGGISWAPFLLACAGSLLTAVYMLRWWLRIFLGAARSPALTQHAHDPSWCATLVLIIMAPFTVHMPQALSRWLEWSPDGGAEAGHGNALLIGGLLLAAGALFGALAWWRLPGAITRRPKPTWWVRLFPGHSHDCGSHGVPHVCKVWCGKVIVVALAPFTLLVPWALGFVLDHRLQPALSDSATTAHYHAMLVAIGLFSSGTLTAVIVWWWLPWMGTDAGSWLRQRLSQLHAACAELWGIDRLWDRLFVRGLGAGLGRLSARLDLGSHERLARLEGATTEDDRNELSLDGAIDGIGHTCGAVGRAGSLLHGGRLGMYLAAAAILAAAALLVGLLL